MINCAPAPNQRLVFRVLALLFIVAGSHVAHAADVEKSKNETLVNAAWQHFNAKDYPNAIGKCKELLDEYRPAADRAQLALERKKAPPPIKGKPKDSEKAAIFEQGLLNDVATCLFIIGRSAEYQGRKDAAREAYTAATKYTYARTWDPKGWFWAPGEASSDRLTGLQ